MLLEQAGIEILLVGDSLGMVIQGDNNTLAVTMDNMVYHGKCVSDVAKNSLIIIDMPFMSYAKPKQALKNAARLVCEGGANMIKLEGGSWLCETVKLLSERGIPVCSHLGLTPQSVHKLSGYKVQGRSSENAQHILDDALALQDAGADLLILECIPRNLATKITQTVKIPTIGIGAGIDCDGQVLVTYDMLGLFLKSPSFSKNFLKDSNSILEAFKLFASDVKNSKFPNNKYSFLN
jgi:3-methyl-2-oxobutanoate hydroxymethyltransferase